MIVESGTGPRSQPLSSAATGLSPCLLIPNLVHFLPLHSYVMTLLLRLLVGFFFFKILFIF